MDEPIQIIAKIVRWGKKGGKIKKYGNGANNGSRRQRSPAALLVEQAMSFGWLNGHRLRKKK